MPTGLRTLEALESLKLTNDSQVFRPRATLSGGLEFFGAYCSLRRTMQAQTYYF